MPQNYTPTATYAAYPVSLPAHGDVMNEAFFTTRYEDLYNRVRYTKDTLTTGIGRLDAGLIKLGITVADPADVTLPTYTSAYKLVGNLSHQSALVALDNELRSHNTKLNNLNTNIGSNVVNSAPPVYTSAVYLDQGDPLVTAIGKLDAATDTIDTAVSGFAADIAELSTDLTNIAAKVGTGADAATPFDYATNYFLTDAESLKLGVEKFDKIGLATRRQNDYNTSQWVQQWLLSGSSLTDKYVYGHETFIDLTKRHVNTTASIDLLEQKASGAATAYYLAATASTSSTHLTARWYATGTIVVKFNLIGSFLDGDMTTVAAPDTVTAAASAGTDLVIKVELTGTAELYNLAFIGGTA